MTAGMTLLPRSLSDPMQTIADDLARQRWAVRESFFDPALCVDLLAGMQAQDQAGNMAPAAIGRAATQILDTNIRTDRTSWLTGGTDSQRIFLQRMEQLRLELNCDLCLGLFDYEAHYALYQAGGYYKTHLDSFRGARNRIVSTVTYLTSGWREEDGGHLVLYHSENNAVPLQKILPQAGTLAVFLSEEIPHEVLPPARERVSIAGWFRANASGSARVDPA